MNKRIKAHTWYTLLLGLTLALGSARAQPVHTRGELLFQTDFETPESLAGWSSEVALDSGFHGGKALTLDAKGNLAGKVITRKLPAESLRGCKIRTSAVVRAQEVGSKPNAWNGIKVMLVIESPSGTTYPQAPLETGSFDWRDAHFTVFVPADATNISLVLGLEQVTGKVWFDQLQIRVVKPPSTWATTQSSGPIYKGHSLPRLRGAMVSPNIDAESVRVLGEEWHANLIRFQLIRFGKPNQPSSLEDYNGWLETELKRLDALLPLCEKYGILVVVDLHSPPGGKATVSGYVGSDSGLFSTPQAQEKFVAVWRQIATRYRNSRGIWGYDLANEPVEEEAETDCDDWQTLAERAAVAIRQIDPVRTIIVEPAQWGNPEGLKELVPLNVSNVVYSVHMYLPHAFTHQGVHDSGPSYRYPGLIQGKPWDKGQLQQALQPVLDFQKRYHAHIYVGEFSAIRWAPDDSTFRYLSDLIDIFEAHDWDWSYHAFREWNGWSVEHGSERENNQPAVAETNRQKLLREWFGRNLKPKS